MFHNRIIVVDGEQTHFLRHWVGEYGVIIEVSGPESLRFDEHSFTELDGSELDLSAQGDDKAQLENAIVNDPEGAVCHFCGEMNDLADDCGFFYILDPDKPLFPRNANTGNQTFPTCDACYDKNIHFHQKIYGIGER